MCSINSTIFWLVVLTCFNHLEICEFVNGRDDIPYEMENENCLKPPTSICVIEKKQKMKRSYGHNNENSVLIIYKHGNFRDGNDLQQKMCWNGQTHHILLIWHQNKHSPSAGKNRICMNCFL